MEIGSKDFKREHRDFYGEYPKTNAVAEVLGSMFTGADVAAPASKGALKGPDLLRMVLEVHKIKKVVNALKANPFKGNADDILAVIRPIWQKPYVIKRGHITGTMDNPILQEKRLFEDTGVYKNFGLTKGMFKHGMKADNYTILPKALRRLKPFEVMDKRQRWRYPTGTGRNYRTVFSKDNQGQNSLITHFVEDEGVIGKMSEKL
jgi:hypothetical protein